MAIFVSFHGLPAIVYIDVVVSEVSQSELNDLISGILHNLCVEAITAEFIPGVPSHLRGLCQGIGRANQRGNYFGLQLHLLRINYLL